MSALFDLSANGPERPVFAKPWHATAFGILVALHESGLFDWPTWVETFARRDRAAPDMPGESVEDGYHRRVLEALAELLKDDGRVTPETLAQMDEAWRRAYLGTPHGQPVELANGAHVTEAMAAAHHDHDHHHHHSSHLKAEPVTVSPARGRA